VLLLKTAILIVLSVLFIQDLKSRSVYWFLFPVLVILFIGIRLYEYQSFADILAGSIWPLAFLILQLITLSLYYSLKQRRWTNITTSLLGWGDILLLFCLCFYLSLFNFILFYVSSLFVVLISWAFIRQVSKTIDKNVPLAGLQALLFGLLFLLSAFRAFPDVTNDLWAMQYLSK